MLMRLCVGVLAASDPPARYRSPHPLYTAVRGESEDFWRVEQLMRE